MDEWGELLRKFAGQTNPANGKKVEGASIRWDEWGYFTYSLFAQGLPGFLAEDGSSNSSLYRQARGRAYLPICAPLTLPFVHCT